MSTVITTGRGVMLPAAAFDIAVSDGGRVVAFSMPGDAVSDLDSADQATPRLPHVYHLVGNIQSCRHCYRSAGALERVAADECPGRLRARLNEMEGASVDYTAFGAVVDGFNAAKHAYEQAVETQEQREIDRVRAEMGRPSLAASRRAWSMKDSFSLVRPSTHLDRKP